jgi:hypothetical protein
MLFNISLLALLAPALSLAAVAQQPLEAITTTAQTAVTIFTSRDWLDCQLITGWEAKHPDGSCFALKNQRMDVRDVREGCRSKFFHCGAYLSSCRANLHPSEHGKLADMLCSLHLCWKGLLRQRETGL